jgi:hypothetical protein
MRLTCSLFLSVLPLSRAGSQCCILRLSLPPHHTFCVHVLLYSLTQGTYNCQNRQYIMKMLSVITAFLLSLACLPGYASAAISFPVTRNVPENKELYPRELKPRLSTPIEQSLDNDRPRGAYYATVVIGNPGQSIHLDISTGSSDIWLIDSSAPVCANITCYTPCMQITLHSSLLLDLCTKADFWRSRLGNLQHITYSRAWRLQYIVF